MAFTRAQVEQLLKPINPRRVLKDGKGNSHVSQQDVTAHLTRIFGFGSYDIEIDGPHLVFEQERHNGGKPTGRWDVCYRAKARLTIKDPTGEVVCVFEGSATDTAENQKRGDAHDLALKSAESTAKKRAATNLGDQFGLSLYNKGQMSALVGKTLVMPDGDGDAAQDVQEDVPQQVSLGHDEIDRGEPAPEPGRGEPQHSQPAPQTTADSGWVEAFEKRLAQAPADQIGRFRQEVLDGFKHKRLDSDTGNRLMDAIKQRQDELQGAAA